MKEIYRAYRLQNKSKALQRKIGRNSNTQAGSKPSTPVSITMFKTLTLIQKNEVIAATEQSELSKSLGYSVWLDSRLTVSKRYHQ